MFNDYKHVYYTLAPSGRYVGWTFYENGIYYASDVTIEGVFAGVKHQLYLNKKVSYRGYTLATKPTPRDQVPIDRMKQAFLTRAYWGRKSTDTLTAEQKAVQRRIKDLQAKDAPVVEPEEPKVEYDYYDYKFEDGNLVVFGCKKVAEYPVKVPFAKARVPETLNLQLGE